MLRKYKRGVGIQLARAAACLALSMVFLTGCATLGGGTGKVEKAVSLINQGDADLTAQNSAVPFVFEGEILARVSDVNAVWRNLSINGFRLDPSGIADVGRTDDSSYLIFSERSEMRIFFEKYVPDGSTIAAVESNGRGYHLLIGKVSGGYPQILGITGF